MSEFRVGPPPGVGGDADSTVVSQTPSDDLSTFHRWLRLLLTPVLAGGAVVLGISVFIGLASLKEPPPQVQPSVRVFRVPVLVVERSDVRPLVSTFGTARSDQEATIAAEVAGTIVDSKLIDVGASVAGPEPAGAGAAKTRPGDLLVTIDPETYRQRVLQAEALLAQDEAELAKLAQDVKNSRRLLEQKQESLKSAQAQLDLQRKLFKDAAGRETELRRAELEYQQVEAAALQLQSDIDLEEVRRKQILARQAAHEQDLELARLELRRADIHAPFAGVVSEVLVETGQYVRPGEPLLKLANVNRVEIPLPLPLGQSGPVSELLAAGETPVVQLAEHETAECRWVGRVTRIAPVANEMTRTVDVFAEVDNTQSRDALRPGTFVHARIESGTRSNLLLIPRGAIIDGAVFVAKPSSAQAAEGDSSADESDSQAERRPVEIQGMLQGFAIITSGLVPGDRVVLTNLDVLSDGTRLKVIEERTVISELEREEIPGFEVIETAPLADIPAENATASRE